MLPPAETAESRRLYEVVLDIRRRRAARLGLPEPEDVPDPEYRPGMSLADGIRAARQRRPVAEAANDDQNLARRLERLEDSLLPALEEPFVIHIIGVDVVTR